MLADKQIVLGICGSIAAYKAAMLARSLTQAGAHVRVMMTQAATEFITPLTFEAITHQNVATDQHAFSMQHIDLAKWADTIILAPTSASTLSKLACGIADNLLTATCLAHPNPLYVVPAMNQHMWENPAIQAQVATLQQRGHLILGPDDGHQACGDVGYGRMLAPEAILNALQQGNDAFKGINVLITAGPTQEPIDPVRYISNRSSGKMGYALAHTLHQQGARVTLIHGPTHVIPPPCNTCIAIQTANQMNHEVMQHIHQQQLFISCAAVADYTPQQTHHHKIKKQANNIRLELTKTPDILARVCALKNKPYTVGFAVETQDLRGQAQKKRLAKNCDMLVANLTSEQHTPFGADTNQVVVFQANQAPINIIMNTKATIARSLCQLICDSMKMTTT